MKNYCILLCSAVLIFGSCKKDNGPAVIPVNASMEADFNFKSGSYWIYLDSATGVIDSAYVYSNTEKSSQLGCVFSSNMPYFDVRTICLKVDRDTISSYNENWTISMVDSTFSLSLFCNKDSLESRLNLQSFTFPFAIGNSNLSDGCLMFTDSASIPGILPSLSLSNQDYNNVALLNHAARNGYTEAYNDCFFLSPGVGFIKMVFNHPSENIYRVLKLQRYYIAN